MFLNEYRICFLYRSKYNPDIRYLMQNSRIRLSIIRILPIVYFMREPFLHLNRNYNMQARDIFVEYITLLNYNPLYIWSTRICWSKFRFWIIDWIQNYFMNVYYNLHDYFVLQNSNQYQFQRWILRFAVECGFISIIFGLQNLANQRTVWCHQVHDDSKLHWWLFGINSTNNKKVTNSP